MSIRLYLGEALPSESSSLCLFFFSLIWQLLFLIFSLAISRGSIWYCQVCWWKHAHTHIKFRHKTTPGWEYCCSGGAQEASAHCICMDTFSLCTQEADRGGVANNNHNNQFPCTLLEFVPACKSQIPPFFLLLSSILSIYVKEED